MTGNTIDMQLMRYINLFAKVSNVSTTHCFVYNNIIIFAVPYDKVYMAIGKNGGNMKRLGEILRKKIKVVELPRDESQEQIENFVSHIVEPISFNKIEIYEGIVSISAGRQNKAALIGRNRAREQELEDILKKFFHVQKLKII